MYNSQASTQWTESMYYEKLDKNFKGGDTKEAIATSMDRLLLEIGDE